MTVSIMNGLLHLFQKHVRCWKQFDLHSCEDHCWSSSCTVSSREGENRIRGRRRRRELIKVVDLPVIRGRKVDTLPAHTAQYCKLLMFGSLSVSTCNILWTSYYSITFFPKTEAREQIWLFHAISMPVRNSKSAEIRSLLQHWLNLWGNGSNDFML